MSEQHEPTHNSLEAAIEAFQGMGVPDRPPDAAVLARLEARPVGIPVSKKGLGYRMRFLVPSAAAAALVIGVAGLLLLSGTAAIALADVVKAAQMHKLVRYREELITDPNAKTIARVYADFTAPRQYSESRVHEPNGESVLLSVHDGKYHLTTNSLQRTARLDFAPTGYKSLLCCLEDFQQKKGVSHEKSDLDGEPTVKYWHTEGNQTIILWVDAKTKLPLRLEQKFIDPSPGITHSTLVWTDFAWDPELPQGVANLNELFSTRPPDGYALDDRTKNKKQ
jgi:hypothetical protein